MIDESHRLDHHQLDAIRMLTNYEMDATTPFAVLRFVEPAAALGIGFGIAQRAPRATGFTPTPKRWTFERTLRLAYAAQAPGA